MGGELDFKCAPGDLILVRTRAMRKGESPLVRREHYPNSWNELGTDDYAAWSEFDDAHTTPCMVIGIVVFPSEAPNLDHLVLLAPEGIAYVFDDPMNGFWIPAGEEDGMPDGDPPFMDLLEDQHHRAWSARNSSPTYRFRIPARGKNAERGGARSLQQRSTDSQRMWYTCQATNVARTHANRLGAQCLEITPAIQRTP